MTRLYKKIYILEIVYEYFLKSEHSKIPFDQLMNSQAKLIK